MATSSPRPSAPAPLRAWLALALALGLAATSVAAALPAHDHASHDHAAGAAADAGPDVSRASGTSAGSVATASATTVGASDAATEPVPAYDRSEVPLVEVPVPGEINRAPVPRDRHELARGCYTMTTSGGAVGRAADGGLASGANDAEPLRVQATTLGRVLLRATDDTFVAAPAGTGSAAAETVTGSTPGGMAGGLTVGATDEAAGAAAAAVDTAEAAVAPSDAVVLAASPSPRADWAVAEVPGGFTLGLADGRVLVVADGGRLALVDADAAADLPPATTRFGFRLADGCAALPDTEIGIDGPHVGGATPYQETRGYLDAHVHMMAFEFLGGAARCGRPWHPYGVEHALVDCPDHEPGGRGALLEVAVSGGDPVAGHDTVGWPTFVDWPAYGSLTHEQMYYRWLERSWRGGLRLMVNLLVDNNQLCKLWAYKDHGCNEMDGVRLQAQRLRELEAYVDAQSGGPGEGWLRIVTDPFQAREVINSGRLAVVMGIEVSVLFDCRVYLGVPQCDTDDIDRQLAEVHDLGVRQMELVNKFDNALSGVTGDSGTTGVVVNGGNFLDTGSFWRMRTCDTDDHGHDRTQPNPHDEGMPDDLTGRDALAGGILQTAGASGRAPVYPEGPHCNELGLTLHGRYLLERMAERGMIFDPDHMSARARHEALDVMAALGHSGLVSSHGWADETVYPRIYELGGVVTPYPRRADRFVDEWRAHRRWADPRYLFGIGYGADTNGFGAQAPPRPGADERPLAYPFTGFGGTTVDRQVSGERTYDLNVDGVAHYGLYPDFVADATLVAGDDAGPFTQDLVRGPEAYLQMWERALGVARSACDDPGLAPTVAELESLPRGATTTEVLHAVGQPAARVADTFRYCAAEDGAVVRVEVTFDADGRLVGTGRA